MTYSYLNYSDDYLLDEAPVEPSTGGGRKFLFLNTRSVSLAVPVRGRFVIAEKVEYKIQGSGKLQSEANTLYKGSIQIQSKANINGNMSKTIESKNKMIGTNRIKVAESVEITGKKDYTDVIRKLEKLVDLIEPFGPYKDFDACVRDQMSKGKDADTARKICGALQRDLE